MKKILIPVVIVVAVAALVAAVVIVTGNMKTRKHDPLTAYSDTYGGDMNGCSHDVYVKLQDDGMVSVLYYDKDWYGQDPEISEYIVPASLLAEIEEVFDRCGMYAYNNLLDNPVQILDGGTSSYRFSCGDLQVYFGDRNIIPTKGGEGIREINGIIRQAAEAGEKLPGLVHPESSEDYEYGWTPEEGTVDIHVNEYSRGNLYFSFGNASGNELTVGSRARVFLLDGDVRQEVFAEDEDHEITVYSEYFNESNTIEVGRLQPGMYVITFGDYEDEFEIH